MLELESLTLVDAYEWLGTGSVAAEYLCCNQSTVSRSIQKFKRLEKDLRESDCIDLLGQERSIHQRLRFAKGAALRLHAYRWSNYAIRTKIPTGWTINPIGVSATKKDVIDLIVDRKIDAACLPYPLIADADKTWIECIPVFSSHLQLLARKGNTLSLEGNLSLNDISSNTTLQALDFVPKIATECSRQIDVSLFGENSVKKSDPTAKGTRYWGIPLTTLVAPDLKAVDFVSPCPYVEFLVVRKEWAEHPMTLQLLGSVKKTIGQLLYARSELQQLSISA